MKFIRPTPITDAVLVSSSVPENDYAAYSAGTTYALADRVITTATHKIYESAQAGNVGHALTDTAWWIDVGATNRWKMFDTGVGSQTSDADEIVVELAPGLCNSVALLDIAASSVNITVVDGVTTLYDETFQIGDSTVLADWFEYFFYDISSETTLTVADLPVYSGGIVTVTITAPITARCGTLAIGRMVDIGDTLMGVQTSIVDYSRKETDVYGNTTVVERGFARRISANVSCLNTRLDYITSQLAAIRATPVVWVGDNTGLYPFLTTYAFVKDWSVTIPYANHSEAALTLEGLV
jgi:hypothetical protein